MFRPIFLPRAITRLDGAKFHRLQATPQIFKIVNETTETPIDPENDLRIDGDLLLTSSATDARST